MSPTLLGAAGDLPAPDEVEFSEVGEGQRSLQCEAEEGEEEVEVEGQVAPILSELLPV